MIREYTRLARPFFVLLAIVTLGRWLMGNAFHVPYEKGTNALSIVTLTLFASIFSAAFARRWLGYRLPRRPASPCTWRSSRSSWCWPRRSSRYALGISSYFNEPMALNRQLEPIGFAAAMGFRAGGLVVNTILNGIAGSLGWSLGGLLPPRER